MSGEKIAVIAAFSASTAPSVTISEASSGAPTRRSRVSSSASTPTATIPAPSAASGSAAQMPKPRCTSPSAMKAPAVK